MSDQPIDKFNVWLKANQKHVVTLVLTLTGNTKWNDYINRWCRQEIAKIRGWLISNPKRGKEDWKRFFGNWMIKANAERLKEIDNHRMTAEQEQDYYANKRRSGISGDFVGVGDLMKGE